MVINLVLAALAGLAALFIAVRHQRHYILFLLVVGLLGFSCPLPLGGLNLSAVWLAMLIVLGGMVALQRSAVRVPYRVAERLYLVFLAWCVFEAIRSPSPLFALRLFLKLFYPFLVIRLAHTSLLSEGEALRGIRWLLTVSFLVSLLVGGLAQQLVPHFTFLAASLFWAYAAFADHTAILGMVALAYWRTFRSAGALALGGWYGLSPVLQGIRAGIGGFGLGASFFIVRAFRKPLAMVMLVGLYGAVASALFLVPEVRQHMFVPSASVDPRQAMLRPDMISMEDINTSGRFELWRVVMADFFWPNPLCGSGLGSTQAWFYGGSFGQNKVRVEHSSYVRLLADTGLIGFSLFLATMIACFASGWRAYRQAGSPPVRFFALSVLTTFPALAFCMGFDNLFNYVLPATQYPFALAGILFGLHYRAALRARRDAEPASRPVGLPAKA